MCAYLLIYARSLFFLFFFFNDTATTEIYTLSLHDALPILCPARRGAGARRGRPVGAVVRGRDARPLPRDDRRSRPREHSAHPALAGGRGAAHPSPRPPGGGERSPPRPGGGQSGRPPAEDSGGPVPR